MAKVEQRMALVDASETQLGASRATAANFLSALVAELSGVTNNGKSLSRPVLAVPKAVAGLHHNSLE